MNSLPHPRYRRDIDGLRGIAVLSVLGFHAFPEWVPWGFVGVDVFFVISGYLITTILLESLGQGRSSFMEFYVRRVRRIFPALAVVLASTLAAGWLLLLPADYALLGKHVAAGGGFVSNLVLYFESGYFDVAAATKPLLHLWSLGIEEQFYLVWPLVLYGAHRRAWLVPLAWVAFPALSFATGAWQAFHAPLQAFYFPQDRLWELLAGGLLARAVRGGDRLPGSEAARGVLGLGLFLAGAVFLNEQRAFPGLWALLPVGAAVLWISAPGQHLVGRALASRALVAVGLISYPLYLWHWPLIASWRIVHGEVTPAAATGLVAASFVLAWATFRFVEGPLRFGSHGRGKALALGIAMTIIVVAGLELWRAGGLPQRFPPAVRASESGVEAGEWGNGTCFIGGLAQVALPFEGCRDQYGPGTVLLWGDSHAAHLYPGLKRLLGEAAIVRRTIGACPPIFGFDKQAQPNCRPANDLVLREIREHRPAAVVLAATWDGDAAMPALAATLDELRTLGIRRVVVVGPSPIWSDEMPRLVLRAFQKDPLHRLPWRLADPAGQRWWDIDRAVGQLATERGVGYVSPLRMLCDATDCLVRVGDEPGDLIMWDHDHFTTQGSLLVGRRIEEQLRASP